MDLNDLQWSFRYSPQTAVLASDLKCQPCLLFSDCGLAGGLNTYSVNNSGTSITTSRFAFGFGFHMLLPSRLHPEAQNRMMLFEP